MRTLLLSLAVLAGPTLSAQQVSWMESWPLTYQLNPGLAGHALTYGPGNDLLSVRQATGAFVYGEDLFGLVAVDRLDPATGNMLWTCQLFDSVTVDAVAMDAAGNSYVAGRYMGTLGNCDGSIQGNTSPAQWNVDMFLLAYGPDGTVLWSHDLSVTHPNAGRVASLAVDPSGALWYGLDEFGLADVIRVDEDGHDVETRTIDGVVMLGTVDFDPWGGLYVSGAADQNGLAFAGHTFPTDLGTGYKMFVLRFDPAGGAGFAQFASDVTFQNPTVLDDGQGNAYLAGALMDSTGWGGIHLNGPDWVYSTFVAKLDSTGAFLWAQESDPEGGTIEGDLRRSRGPCIAVDGPGNVYLMGEVRGVVHWPGGVTSDSGGIPQDGATIVKFAPDGTPQWAVNSVPTGGSSFTQTITADPMGGVYFSAHAAGEFTMAPITVNEDGGQDAVVGKLNGLSTGVAEAADVQHLSLWPNPAQGIVNARWNGTTAVNAELLNSAGQRVKAFRLLPGANRFDLGSAAPGLYLLRTPEGAVRVVKE